MTLFEFSNKYRLEDSLLESIAVNDRAGTVRLVVDFCFWQQPGYDESMPETGLVHIDFFNVKSVRYEGWKINSDEITQCIYDEKTNTLRLEALSDITYKTHSIYIKAASVSLKEMSEA